MLLLRALPSRVLRRHFATSAFSSRSVPPLPSNARTFASTESALTPSPSSPPFPLNPFTSTPTVYGGFKIHKSKAALDVAFTRPEVSQVRSSSSYPYFRLDRAGALRLEFAPASDSAPTPQPAGATTRAYQWGSKVTLQLSVTEVGELLAFSGYSTATEVKFFHDPALGGEGEGEVRKELVVKRNPPGKGYYFNCTVSVKASGKQTVMIPVSDGEFEVLVTLCRQLLPSMLAMGHLPPLLRDANGEGQ